MTTRFTAPRAFPAEGARVGIISCLSCGAAVLLDPADEYNMPALHAVTHGNGTYQIGHGEERGALSPERREPELLVDDPTDVVINALLDAAQTCEIEIEGAPLSRQDVLDWLATAGVGVNGDRSAALYIETIARDQLD